MSTLLVATYRSLKCTMEPATDEAHGRFRGRLNGRNLPSFGWIRTKKSLIPIREECNFRFQWIAFLPPLFHPRYSTIKPQLPPRSTGDERIIHRWFGWFEFAAVRLV